MMTWVASRLNAAGEWLDALPETYWLGVILVCLPMLVVPLDVAAWVLGITAFLWFVIRTS